MRSLLQTEVCRARRSKKQHSSKKWLYSVQSFINICYFDIILLWTIDVT